MVLPMGLAGYIKNAYLTVSSEEWKRRNASHYELRNMDNSLSVNNDCMVLRKGPLKLSSRDVVRDCRIVHNYIM